MVVEILFFFLVFIVIQTFGDLPCHCLNVEVAGKWKFERSPHGTSFLTCGYHAPDHNADHFQPSSYLFTPSSTFEVELVEPNIVVDHQGQKIGVWTMVYDEGFEVQLEKEKESYFAFVKYEPRTKGLEQTSSTVADYISHCDQTMLGWFHETSGAYWGCWQGTKISSDSSLQLGQRRQKLKLKNSNVVSPRAMIQKSFHSNMDFVNAINNDPNSKWKATVYEMFEGVSYTELSKKLGATNYIRRRSPVPRSLIDLSEDPSKYEGLPDHWDWRDVNGVNYDSHVRNQGGCGSCYAHASVSALEARFRIASQNRFQPLFSVQNVLDCSIWNQACEGGYPFLVSRHAQAFGLVDEKCEPYTAQDADCEVDRFLLQGHSQQQSQEESALLGIHSNIDASQCVKRYFVKDYHYVGGYYGGTNEIAMMKEIHQNGPITVAFQAPSELFAYKSGVFDKTNDHIQSQDEGVTGLNIWEQTNHAVIAVGWGKLDDGTKYWILKNTWGEAWGEKGYFKILRGVDLCAVESMAVASNVILPEGV